MSAVTTTKGFEKPTGKGKALNIGLWTAQILLAVMFLFAGILKTTSPIAELSQKLVWASAVPEALVRFIGISEFLGALGLILPSITRIKPSLTPIAATGLVIVMALALGFHATRGELAQALPINLFLGGLAGFVAWGRTAKAPITPRA